MKARDCRVGACVNGECRGCKRKTAVRREQRAAENQRHIRALVEKHGFTAQIEQTAQALIQLRNTTDVIGAVSGELVEWL